MDGGFLWKKREGGHIWHTRVWVQGIAQSGFEGGRVAFDDCTTHFWNNLGWGTLIVKRLKSQIIKSSWASKLKGLNSYKDLLPFFWEGGVGCNECTPVWICVCIFLHFFLRIVYNCFQFLILFQQKCIDSD